LKAVPGTFGSAEEPESMFKPNEGLHVEIETIHQLRPQFCIVFRPRRNRRTQMNADKTDEGSSGESSVTRDGKVHSHVQLR
jgi:hypothetical protein